MVAAFQGSSATLITLLYILYQEGIRAIWKAVARRHGWRRCYVAVAGEKKKRHFQDVHYSKHNTTE